MASKDTYRNKAKKGFIFLNLNRNGYLTREEMAKYADIICSLSNTNDSERETTVKQWMKWCEAILPEGQVSEEQFVGRCEEMVTKIPEIVWHENIVCYATIFERLDADKDDFISPEELRRYYKTFGYGDDYDIDQIFRTLDSNNDGLISHDEFTHAAATYWSLKPGYENFFDPPKKKGTA